MRFGEHSAADLLSWVGAIAGCEVRSFMSYGGLNIMNKRRGCSVRTSRLHWDPVTTRPSNFESRMSAISPLPANQRCHRTIRLSTGEPWENR